MKEIEAPKFGRLLSVKYCEPHVAKAIVSGEIWLRPHSFYREAEAKNGLMSDDEEGLLNRDLGNGHHGWGRSLKIGEVAITECSVFGSAQGAGGISGQTEIDEFLCCLSDGRYKRSHHNKMMHGSTDYPEYVPEPKYTNFVVFDIPRLSECLLSWACALFGDSVLGQDRCDYGERRKEITDREKEIGLADPTYGIWTKPARLEIENERRIVLKIFSRPPLGKDDVLEVKCPALLSAIVAFGEIQN